MAPGDGGAPFDIETKRLMNSAKRKLLVQLACSAGALWAMYLTLWLANLHDTSRRWMLLVCLFAVWLSFNLGRSVGLRAKRREGTNQSESQERGLSLASVIWSFIGTISIMLSLGLLLRLTA